MNRIRDFLKGTHELWRATIEWRCPATAPYLILINTSFWASVFYCDVILQSRLLVTLAAGIFGYDILLSSSQDRSIAMHIVTWPFHSMWRTLATITSLHSWHSLQNGQMEIACWMAYSTVACLMISPAWSSYEINGKIMQTLQLCLDSLKNGVKICVINPVKSIYTSIKYCVCCIVGAIKYILFLQFIPPIWKFIMNLSSKGWAGVYGMWKQFVEKIFNTCSRFGQWWRTSIIDPIYRGYVSVCHWLRYWFCAHWWPDFKIWIKRKLFEPCSRGFDCICFCIMYVVCCRWLPPLATWTQKHLANFSRFIYRTAVVPLYCFLKIRLEEFRGYLRRQLHKLAVAIRDSVIWPICLLMVGAGRELSLMFYRMFISPVLDYVYQRYKIAETTLLIYILGPVCEKIVTNIPEKSPFCDDSDVELDGLLPEEHEEEIYEDHDSCSHSSRAASALEDEDNDFVQGLAFPTIDASESSDDEFDLHRKSRNSKQTVRHRKRSNEEGMAAEEDFYPTATQQQRHAHPSDDDFELLT